MMNDLPAEFLPGIWSNPDDDAPRLLLSDWLQERGDPRGDLIRVQCELARRNTADEQFLRLEDEEAALLQKHSAAWRRLLEKEKGVGYGLDHYVLEKAFERTRIFFFRGFVESATFAELKNFLQREPDWLRGRLVRHVRFREMTERQWEALLNSPLLDQLRGLYLILGQIGPAGAEQLANCTALANLEALSLNENHIGGVGLRNLVTAKHFQNLKWLDLSFNGLGSVERLINWEPFPQIRHLNMGLNGSAAAKEIAGSEQAKNLQLFSMRFSDLESADAVALAESSQLENLTFLALTMNRNIGDAGAKAFANTSLPLLRGLALDDTEMTDAGAKALANADRQWTHLSLGLNRLGDAGAIAIAESAAAASLRFLDLRAIGMTNRGAQALLSAEWPHLRYLNVGGAELDESTRKALKKKFRKAVVEKRYL